MYKRHDGVTVRVTCPLTLSLMVGRSWMRMKRKATTGRIQRRDVRNMVSHTLGWFREFLAVPGPPPQKKPICMSAVRITHSGEEGTTE